ncbi:hypothetical protein B0T19DRAFT_2526 [Cercophora scortea]|uniref:Uncharacterized protein n=1 Tax=Cercophora scortea TaxID=314031 RepID=A0AAE0MK78_9PEZI|nr:hypothetical protein B0T19DRAFT_2526 [Cercophora scortea]
MSRSRSKSRSRSWGEDRAGKRPRQRQTHEPSAARDQRRWGFQSSSKDAGRSTASMAKAEHPSQWVASGRGGCDRVAIAKCRARWSGMVWGWVGKARPGQARAGQGRPGQAREGGLSWRQPQKQKKRASERRPTVRPTDPGRWDDQDKQGKIPMTQMRQPGQRRVTGAAGRRRLLQTGELDMDMGQAMPWADEMVGVGWDGEWGVRTHYPAASFLCGGDSRAGEVRQCRGPRRDATKTSGPSKRRPASF